MIYLSVMQTGIPDPQIISTSSMESDSSSWTECDSSLESDFMGSDMLLLAEQISHIDEEILLKSRGYSKKNQIDATTQGEIFLATKDEKLVVIKKIAKYLHVKKEYIKNGFTFMTDKDIVKEGIILKSIAENKDLTNELIVQYIDAFEFNDYYYLVEEYIEGSISLKDFVIKAHQYIEQGRLKLKHYKDCITSILYQLATVLHSLHNNHKCCHLDAFPDNILLQQSDFIENSNGTLDVNPNIHIKLKDFGVSEQFKTDDDSFECNKQFLSKDNEQYLCPDIINKFTYDGRHIDMYIFSMTVYFCYVGSYPYKRMEFTNDLTPKATGEYGAVLNGKLKQCLSMNNKLKFVNVRIMSLLNSLLNKNASKRLNSAGVLKHELFSKFY